MGLSKKTNEARQWSWAATVIADIQALEITNWRNSVFSFGDLIGPSGTRLGLGVELPVPTSVASHRLGNIVTNCVTAQRIYGNPKAVAQRAEQAKAPFQDKAL